MGQSKLKQSKRSRHFLHLRVNDVKIVHGQCILDHTEFFHHRIHLVRCRLTKPVTDLVHVFFEFKQPCERRF